MMTQDMFDAIKKKIEEKKVLNEKIMTEINTDKKSDLAKDAIELENEIRILLEKYILDIPTTL